ncbi:hypothetical protein [Sorangium sp. So ce117]|uniref:hypothetical protein n=1 Tax=Sorangium sp. So ce117 TaxID=3133277 RepID=UPI003F646BCF
MTKQCDNVLFREKIRQYDALLMRVQVCGAQQYTGFVEKVFSRRFEGPKRYGDGLLEFVGSPGHWGQVTLKDGERAIVFVRYLTHSDRYYQDHWRGHLTIVEGGDIAVANWPLLKEGGVWEPEYLRSAARLLEPSNPGKVALPYKLLEQHLHEEIALL